jgi:hypothetical protein
MSSLGYFSLPLFAQPFASPIRAESRIEAIDWVKRIVEIIGNLGNLVGASLLQNRGHIHHSGDGVGVVYEVRGDSEAVWLVRLVYLVYFVY